MTALVAGARRVRWTALLAAVACAQGCASWVHPVSLTPPLPMQPPPRYLADASAPQGGQPPRADDREAPPPLLAKANLPQEPWWTAFGDRALDGLIQEALDRNWVLRDLRGLYHENMLDRALPNGPLWPLQIGVPAVIQRNRRGAPAALGGPAYFVANNEANINLSATYELDLFGQTDSLKKVLTDAAEIQAHFGEAGAQGIAVQVAQTWFDTLAQRALLEVLERRVRLNEDLQRLVNGRFELHLTSRLAALQQEQQLLSTRAQVPLVKARLALLGSQLTSLLARPPNPNPDLVPQDRELPDLPPPPLEGVPADLVKTNAEVRLAQLRVAEAHHRVSQNRASWLPTVTVFANAGLQAFDLQDPVNFEGAAPNSFQTWGFGLRLTWPIFDGGQRLTEARQLTMTVKRRNMLYEQAFLEAVRRVQDAQIQEAKQADNVKALQAQVVLGKRVLVEARQLYEQGSSDYLSVLTALSNLADLENTLILARRILLSYRIELYRALGGTWSRAVVEVVD